MLLPDGKHYVPLRPFDLETMLGRNCLFSCSMFRRAAWEQVGGYDEDPECYEDWHLWLSILLAGWKIEAVPEALFHHCPHPGSSCDRMTDEADQRYRNKLLMKYAKEMVV